MYRYLYVLALCFVVFMGCSSQESSKQVNHKEKADFVQMDHQLFFLNILNDTLNHFMETVGEIHNPLKATRFINIIFLPGYYPEDVNDTLIAFSVQLSPYEIDECQNDVIVKGGVMINGENIGVFYNHFIDLDNIVNEDLLNTEYLDKVKADIPKDTLNYKWYYNGYEWIYKLKCNNLILWKKRELTYQGLDYMISDI